MYQRLYFFLDGNTTVSSPKVTTQVNEEEVKETTTSDTATQQAPKIEDGDTAIGGNLRLVFLNSVKAAIFFLLKK